jgi:hypothetical protein
MIAFATRVLILSLGIIVSGSGRSTVDLAGHPVDPLSPSDARAVVLVFTATDCSISNRYVPKVRRLEAEFAADGVRFWFIYPNPEDTAQVVGSHDAQYSVTTRSALDPAQTLVRRAHVVATPEAAVFVPDGSGWREVYHGRIDDRYLSFGHERPHATQHDLELAIGAALAHRPVPPPGGDPVGCAIMPPQP